MSSRHINIRSGTPQPSLSGDTPADTTIQYLPPLASLNHNFALPDIRHSGRFNSLIRRLECGFQGDKPELISEKGNVWLIS